MDLGCEHHRGRRIMDCGSGSMEEVLLDQFVFRRDGAKPFPGNETTARSCTCIGVPFSVCIDLAAPPAISRFYLEWPGGPKREAGRTCQIVAAHRGCVLFRLTSFVKSKTRPQYLLHPDDCFVYRPAVPSSSWALTRLPTWIRPEQDANPVRGEKETRPDASLVRAEEMEVEEKPESDSSESDWEEMLPTEAMEWAERLTQKRHEEEMALGVDVEQEVMRSSLLTENIGLLCCTHGECKEFVVAELQLLGSSLKVSAELSLFHSIVGQWELKRLPIDYRKRDSMRWFGTQAVVPFGRCLCWVDYRTGMILGDVLKQSPKLSYIPFPSVVPGGRKDIHRGVCVTDGGSSLKFVDVVAKEQPRNTFTIFTYTLTTTEAGRMRWDKDPVTPMTAEELWGLEAPAPIPHEVPLFPLVSMEKPQIIHFLLSEWGDYIDTVTLVTIDMNTRTVLSVHPYIKGEQDLFGEDADLAEAKSSLLQPFLSAEFSESLIPTR